MDNWHTCTKEIEHTQIVYNAVLNIVQNKNKKASSAIALPKGLGFVPVFPSPKDRVFCPVVSLCFGGSHNSPKNIASNLKICELLGNLSHHTPNTLTWVVMSVACWCMCHFFHHLHSQLQSNSYTLLRWCSCRLRVAFLFLLQKIVINFY